MKVIGITGSIATGKTTVAKLFSSLLEAEIIDADDIGHAVIAPKGKAWQEITRIFGENILKDNLDIDRKKLGQIVFSDMSKKKKLDDIVHPEVKKIIVEKLKHYRDSGKKWVIMDVPLLFEAKMEKEVDKIVVVVRDEEAQIGSLKREKGLSLKGAKDRVKAQLSLSEKVKNADFIVYNYGTLQDMKKQVRDICSRLKSENS